MICFWFILCLAVFIIFIPCSIVNGDRVWRLEQQCHEKDLTLAQLNDAQRKNLNRITALEDANDRYKQRIDTLESARKNPCGYDCPEKRKTKNTFITIRFR